MLSKVLTVFLLNSMTWLSFDNKTLMSTADDHPSNSAAETALSATFGAEISLQRFRCTMHKEANIADLMQAPLLQQTRGLLHFALAMQFSGSLQRWKSCFKQFIRRPGVFVYRRFGASGAGSKARLIAIAFSACVAEMPQTKLC